MGLFWLWQRAFLSSPTTIAALLPDEDRARKHRHVLLRALALLLLLFLLLLAKDVPSRHEG